MRRLIGAAVALVAATGCAGNGDATPAVIVTAPEVVTTPNPTTEATDSMDASLPAPTSTTDVVEAELDLGSTTVSRREIGRFDAPIGLSWRPDDDSLYIVEQAGSIVRTAPGGGDAAVVLDIGDATTGQGERGLLGLAFHPVEPLAYIYYTDLDGATTIAEFGVRDDGVFDPATERTVWKLEQPYSNHNGGDLQFGPDQMLYAGVGDGGSGGDPQRRADDPATPFGSLIRLDPTGRADGEYSIPDDNPFGNEVWAYGLRNPWKFNFDASTGDLWIADVGQNQFEEIDLVRAPQDGSPAGRGANFGWSAFEATTRFNDDVEATPDMVSPVLYYEHGGGNCSVSGGAMLERWYVYGDYCTGTVWAFQTAGQDHTDGRNVEIGNGFGNVSAIRNGPDGSVYVLDRNGPVYALVAE